MRRPLVAVVAAALFASSARAEDFGAQAEKSENGGARGAKPLDKEDWIIKQPDQHPDYFAELEVHGLVAYGGGPFLIGRYGLVGFGPGFRANFRILKNGFVPSINDNVAIGVGAELVFDIDNAVHLVTPVVLQWNFWLTKHWSLGGEPGVAFSFPMSTPRGPEPIFVTPTLSAVARYNFNDHVTLVMRLGYPVSSVGVSFFL